MKVLYQKADGTAEPVSEEEVATCDGVNDLVRMTGIEAIDDESGLWVMDMTKDAKLNRNKKRALDTASLANDGTDHPTVVSSAHEAMILNIWDKLVKNLGNSATADSLCKCCSRML